MRKSRKRNTNLSTLERDYRAVAPLAGLLCEQLTTQLSALISNAGIALGFPIQHRVKTWESLAEKLDRSNLRIKSVRELQDLAGLRVILQFLRDVPKVCSIIEDSVQVIRRYDTHERLKTDQFGYASIHFVISLPDSWLSVPTLSPLREIQAEIQVRTLAQHIWASASHTLQYKQEDTVPPSLLRSIYRVSALLETVDLEFERVLFDRGSYRQQLETLSGQEDNEELNVDLLESTMDELLPRGNKKDDEEYARLLSELFAANVRTRKQLVALWNKYQSTVLKEEAAYVARSQERLTKREPITGTTVERTQAGVYFSHSGLIRNLISLTTNR